MSFDKKTATGMPLDELLNTGRNMGRSIDYRRAREFLEQEFAAAEDDFRRGTASAQSKDVCEAITSLFMSRTQAYRESLVGCALARILDPTIDIRLPYMNQGQDAYNGRTLDERVVNPFLHERQIPCSRGPFLSAFRRSVRFVPETAAGLRDQAGFRQMLSFIGHLRAGDQGQVRQLLRALLHGFVQLRATAEIPLTRVARISIEQYEILIDRLLATPSGGRLPVLFVVGMLRTLTDCYGREWEIDAQGINVADAPSGAGGDVTVRRRGAVVLVVEVTERPIDRARVVATFRTKIGPRGLDDYLFFYSGMPPDDDARAAARGYFAQGHEVNFVPVRDWLLTTMTTIGPRCRAMFNERFLELLGDREIPADLKVAWNDHVAAVAGS